MKNDTQLVLSDARGPLTDLLVKLAGKDGKTWLRELKSWLRENPWERSKASATVKLGAFKDVESLRSAIKKAGVYINHRTKYILDEITLTETESSMELVILSVKELGFSMGALYQDICQAANDRGFDKCPPEVAALYLLQHRDRLEEDSKTLHFAIELIGSFGFLYLFCVGGVKDGLWLDIRHGKPPGFWDSSSRFVFGKRKSP